MRFLCLLSLSPAQSLEKIFQSFITGNPRVDAGSNYWRGSSVGITDIITSSGEKKAFKIHSSSLFNCYHV